MRKNCGKSCIIRTPTVGQIQFEPVICSHILHSTTYAGAATYITGFGREVEGAGIGSKSVT